MAEEVEADEGLLPLSKKRKTHELANVSIASLLQGADTKEMAFQLLNLALNLGRYDES